MLKVINQKVILQIAWTAYKAEKKRNFYAVLAIVLTSFLLRPCLPSVRAILARCRSARCGCREWIMT